MTKISKKAAYPVKIPVRKDYFVGTDSENNRKTVNFDFESTAKLINELNGTPILNYIFKTDNNIPLAVLTDGVFLSEGNETTVANISKLYINKKNFHEENMSDLFRFIAVNREVFVMKLRNSSNLANAVYFKITDATEFQDHFVLDVAISISNTAVQELVNFNVYFFDFELNSASVGLGSYPDTFLQIGTIQKVGTTVSIAANSFQWRINNIEYLTTSAFSQVVNPATDGYYRIDLIVANTSGGYQLIQGAESLSIVSKPDLPANTLEVTFIPVYGSTIGNITPSPDNSIAKQVSDTLIGNGQMDLVKGKLATGSDFFRIRFGQNSQDEAELEIAVADNGSEPIFFRQYIYTHLSDGTYVPFNSVLNELAIFDSNGDTRIPNDLYVNNQLFIPTNYYTKTEVNSYLGNKVDKVTGYSLTKNDLTDLLKASYDSAVTNAQSAWTWIATNGSNLLSHLSRTDNPHNVTAAQVGAPSGSGTSTGTNTGDETASSIITKIGDGTKINQSYLPSYVDDVLEYANLTGFPTTGESGKIYVAIDSSKQYRWTGSSYLQITNGLIASTGDIPEGSNLYFTTARVLAVLLSGLSLSTGGAIISTDSILVAFGKLQKQITDNTTAIGLKANSSDMSQLLRYETTWTGGSQTFTLPNTYYAIQNVIVQGVSLSSSQYTLTSPNQVTINDTLDSGDYVVIIYGTNASANLAPYYTQAQVDALIANSTLPYKVYTAILNQTNTSNPVATVLNNTFEDIINWSRSGVGVYSGTLSSPFLSGKTVLWLQGGMNSDTTIYNAYRSANSVITITTTNNGVLSDNEITNSSIEIKVYN
jgi:hypothetical protein